MHKPLIWLLILPLILKTAAPATASVAGPEKVILDTDIGDDVDDAFALALLLRSPEIQLLGITTAFGDTHLRARLVSRFLEVAGASSVPVAEGPKTKPATKFTQAAWAWAAADRHYPDGVHFALDEIRQHPGEITLIAVAPLTNIGAMIKQDPVAFRKLKRVVLMGGSVRRGYGDEGRGHADPEWNILNDIPAARALFSSGVPIFVLPLDSTQIKLDRERATTLFKDNTSLTNALQELTALWAQGDRQKTPTLFDAVAAAYAIDPSTCPMTAMRLDVDSKGFTRQVAGSSNSSVCLEEHSELFFRFYLPRVAPRVSH